MTISLGNSTRPELAMEKARQQGTNALLQFPSDLSGQSMLMIFRDYKYVKPGERGGLLKNGSTIVTTTSQSSSILLPIPTDLSEKNSIDISDVNQGGLNSVISDVMRGLADKGNIKDITSDAYSDISSFISNINGMGGQSLNRELIKDSYFLLKNTSLGSKLGITPDQIKNVEIGIGAIQNPKQTLAFNGVDLKSYSFKWTLAPRNRKESDTIRDIANLIKRKILPSYANAGPIEKAFLNYPNTVDIYLLGVAADYYMTFKTCMISDFSVDYASEGLSFLTGGKPSVVNFSMTLKEMEIHTAEDYTATPETQASRNGH